MRIYLQFNNFQSFKNGFKLSESTKWLPIKKGTKIKSFSLLVLDIKIGETEN